MPMVLASMAEAGIGFGDLDLLAVTVGPGAFTGLRVGLAAARGMALATGLPCVGVGTLDAVAAAVPMNQRSGGGLLVAIDSRRGDVFAGTFADDGIPLHDPQVIALDQIARIAPAPPVVVAGDAAGAVLRRLAEAGIAARAAPVPEHPSAAAVAAIAARRWDSRQTSPLPSSMPSPVYLRAPAVTPPVAGGRRRP